MDALKSSSGLFVGNQAIAAWGHAIASLKKLVKVCLALEPAIHTDLDDFFAGKGKEPCGVFNARFVDDLCGCLVDAFFQFSRNVCETMVCQSRKSLRTLNKLVRMVDFFTGIPKPVRQAVIAMCVRTCSNPVQQIDQETLHLKFVWRVVQQRLHFCNDRAHLFLGKRDTLRQLFPSTPEGAVFAEISFFEML